MGARASNLRNRQQVQDSSDNGGLVAVSDAALNGKAVGNAFDDLATNGIVNNNNGDSNIDVDDVCRIKERLRAIDASQGAANGISANGTQADDTQQIPPPSTTAAQAKVSTLQRQASQIQSLAQRIKRSSSLRAPKLRGLLPAFVTGRRKVSPRGSEAPTHYFTCID